MLIGVAPPPNNYMVYWLIKELILEGPRLENSGWSTSVKISIDAKLHSIDFPIKRKTEDELGRFPWSKEVWKSNFRQYGHMISRGEKSQRREEKRREDWEEERISKKRKAQKKEDADARKGRKVAKHCVFPMICGSGGSKSRFAKAAGAEPAGQMRDEKLHAVVARSTFASEKAQNLTFGPLLEVEMSKKCMPLWCEAHVEVKMHKTHQLRTTFGSWDVEIVHAVVARSTFRSQNVQNTPTPDHFWKLRCGNSARRCGAKHI